MALSASFEDLRSPARNFVAHFLSQAFGKVSGLIFGFVAARLLGSSGFGDYAFLNAFLSYALVITDFGLSPFLVREMSQRPEHRISIFASGLSLRFALALLSFAGLLLIGFVSHLSPAFFTCLFLAGSCALLYAWNSSLTDLLTSHERLRKAALVDVICQIIFLAIVMALLWKTSSIVSVFIALFLANAARAAILGFLARSDIRNMRRQDASIPACHSLLKEALPFGLLGFLGTLYFKMDILILYGFHPGSAVGWYEGAYRFLEAAMVLSSSLMTALFPMLSRLGKDSETSGDLHQAFLRSTKFLIVSGLFCALAVSSIAAPLVRFCYGPAFAPTIPLVPVLMTALVFFQINAPNSRLLLALGEQKRVVGLTCIALAFNILLNLALIPRWGAYGAAVATLLSEIAGLALFYAAVASRVGTLPWVSLLVKPMLCASAFLVCWLLLAAISVWLSFVIGSMAFLACFFALRIFDATDLKILKHAMGYSLD